MDTLEGKVLFVLEAGLGCTIPVGVVPTVLYTCIH